MASEKVDRLAAWAIPFLLIAIAFWLMARMPRADYCAPPAHCEAPR